MLTSLKRWWRPPPTLDATRWVVLDVESTGLDVRRDRLLAIAAVAVQVTDGRARIDAG
jgi:DNA polymerase-3 subunit epsilon